MHSTALEKNAVTKSYASAVFPVNEKCTLITQVWQNLALFPRSMWFAQHRAGRAPRSHKAMKNTGLWRLYAPSTPRVMPVYQGLVRLARWTGPLTPALAPEMLGFLG
jgi:hypothetical protein